MKKKTSKHVTAVQTRAKILAPPLLAPADHELGQRVRDAVDRAYRDATENTPRPIFSDEMLALAARSEDSDGDDPLCLFRYFHLTSTAEWYVIDAFRFGAGATNMITGESAVGHVEFFAFCMLDDPGLAELGCVSLDRCSGLGIRDIPPLCPGVASVELDRFYRPERLSVVEARIKGTPTPASTVGRTRGGARGKRGRRRSGL